jgi:CubicO group peptidase (beta-lactamase class C family)
MPRAVHRVGVTILLALAVSACSVEAEASESRGPRDYQELSRFLGELVPPLMMRWHAPGAVFVLVKDGQVFLAKGYGYADLEVGLAADPDRTVFRVYSVSKAVTATAAMQLVEQGRLALDRDVNEHLPPPGIPATFSEPITLFHLLTHTSGLDDRYLPARAGTPAELLAAGQYLAHNLPPRLMPPGQLIRYSNQNSVLAGYLIQSASGEPFARYVDAHVFFPLDMHRSSFSRPPALVADMAAGYQFRRGVYRRLGHAAEPCAPSGSMIATASDMSHLMLAYLAEGRYGEHRILQPETVRTMLSRRFTLDPRLSGVGYGFWERSMNGERVFEHAGDSTGFVSLMLLVPDRSLGLFLSVNCEDAGPLIGEVVRGFFDHYFSYTHRAAATAGGVPRPAAAAPAWLSGIYRYNSYPAGGIEKLVLLAGGGREIRVVVADAELTMEVGPQRRTYVQEEPLFYRETAGSAHSAFKRGWDGRWHLVAGPYGVLERVPFYGTFKCQVLWLACCVLVLASFLVAWPALWLVRRIKGRRIGGTTVSRWAVGTALAVCACAVVFVAAVVPVMLGPFGAQLTAGLPTSIRVLLALPPLGAALTATVIPLAVVAWRRRLWTLSARLHYTATAVAALAMVAWFEQWNILRWWFVES